MPDTRVGLVPVEPGRAFVVHRRRFEVALAPPEIGQQQKRFPVQRIGAHGPEEQAVGPFDMPFLFGETALQPQQLLPLRRVETFRVGSARLLGAPEQAAGMVEFPGRQHGFRGAQEPRRGRRGGERGGVSRGGPGGLPRVHVQVSQGSQHLGVGQSQAPCRFAGHEGAVWFAGGEPDFRPQAPQLAALGRGAQQLVHQREGFAEALLRDQCPGQPEPGVVVPRPQQQCLAVSRLGRHGMLLDHHGVPEQE